MEFSSFNLLIEKLLSKENIFDLLDELINEITKTFHAERATFYFYNDDVKELWSYIAKNLEINSVRVPLGEGVAGTAAKRKKLLNIKDAASCKFFFKTIDKKTGFETKTLLTAPLLNQKNKLLGVLQIINKKDGSFTKKDADLLKAIVFYATFALENIYLLQEQETLLRSTLNAMASAIDAKDPVTAGHSHRVTYYALKLGKALNLTDLEMKMLEYAAFLHDVGKIGVPDHVLQKTSRLSNDEFDLIKKHPIFTYQILQHINFPRGHEQVPTISSDHHEYLDGSGYPHGIKRKNIHKLTRIITVADIYDALTAFDRPYKKSLKLTQALAILRKEAAQKRLESKIVETFINKKLYRYELRKTKRLDANVALKYSIISLRKSSTLRLTDNQQTESTFFRLPDAHNSQSKNVSEGGILFTAKNHLPVGTYLECYLNILNKEFRCIGKIAWAEKIVGTKKFQVGIGFVNLSSKAAKELSRTVQQYNRKRRS